MSASFEGKTAVVTGVTSGIGESIAGSLLEHGATVIGLARSEAKLAAMARRSDGRFVPVVVDLASPEKRGEALTRLAKEHPHIDFLVSNAAECLYEGPLTVDIDVYRRLLETNVLAGIDLVQTLSKRMEAGGHVVQISSVTARFLPAARFAPYAMTKVLIEHFIEAARLELHPRGVKVSVVAPGLVATPIYDKVAGFEKTLSRLNEQVKKWLDPADVADAVLWMLSRPEHVAVSEMVIMPREQAR